MIRSLKCSVNSAIPHLTNSLIMQAHKGVVHFSTEKPNVIVGPNGSGKTALMTALSMSTLTHFTPQSTLDPAYVRGQDAESMWKDSSNHWEEATFLPGIDLDWDAAPGIFFRPGHIPGNDNSVAASMMCGYFDQARAYGNAVRNKSSGQAGQALLEVVHERLSGHSAPYYDQRPWSYGSVVEAVTHRSFDRKSRQRANAIISRYLGSEVKTRSIVLMDEPEQSLDAMAEMKLWQAINASETNSLQVIVATHSLYPILHPEGYHIIETQPGYMDAVRSLALTGSMSKHTASLPNKEV